MVRCLSFVFVFLLAVPLIADDGFYSPETAAQPIVLDYSPETAADNLPVPDPKYGGRWIIRDGRNVWDHLAQDHHRGYIIGDFRSLTFDGAHDLHSDLHNTGGVLNAADYEMRVQPATVQVTAPAQTTLTYAPEILPAPVGVAAANCPDGNCPVRLAPVRVVRAAGNVTQRTVSRSRSVIQRGRSRLFRGGLFQRWRSRRGARGARVRWFGFNRFDVGAMRSA